MLSAAAAKGNRRVASNPGRPTAPARARRRKFGVSELSSYRPIRRRRARSDPGQFLQQVAVQSLPGLKIGDREILIGGVGLAIGQGEAEQ